MRSMLHDAKCGVGIKAQGSSIDIARVHPSDGGSAFTRIERAQLFEQAVRAVGTPVEVFYYEAGRHNGIFESEGQYRDEVRRMAVFVRAHARQ